MINPLVILFLRDVSDLVFLESMFARTFAYNEAPSLTWVYPIGL